MRSFEYQTASNFAHQISLTLVVGMKRKKKRKKWFVYLIWIIMGTSGFGNVVFKLRDGWSPSVFSAALCKKLRTYLTSFAFFDPTLQLTLMVKKWKGEEKKMVCVLIWIIMRMSGLVNVVLITMMVSPFPHLVLNCVRFSQGHSSLWSWCWDDKSLKGWLISICVQVQLFVTTPSWWFQAEEFPISCWLWQRSGNWVFEIRLLAFF